MNIDDVEDFIANNNEIAQLYDILALTEKKIKTLKFSVDRYPYFVDLEKFLKNNFTNYTHEILQANHNWRQLQNTNFDKDLIFIQMFDGFEYNLLRSFTEENDSIKWQYRQSEQIKFLVSLAKTHPQKVFVLLTSLKFLERELDENFNLENFVPVCIGGDIFHEYEEYKTVKQVLNKTISDKHVICLNNVPRPHRVATVLYLILKKLDKHCTISFISNDIRRNFTWNEIEAEFFNVSTAGDWIYFNDLSLKVNFEETAKKLETYDFLKQDVYYNNSSKSSAKTQNVINFNERLSNLYKQSLVEIITESTCFEPTLNLTEKFTNSIYGCNLPIFISTQGTVKYLRDQGFDTFDDIIDHSYDNEVNPFYRLKKAIDLNSEIITNRDLALELWQKSKQRFIDNKNFFETKFYDIVDGDRKKDLLKIKSNLAK